MQRLITHPYIQTNSVVILAEIYRFASVIQLEFIWEDPNQLIHLPNLQSPQRAKELWRTTCFEAFIQPEDQTQYYEINLSPSAAWDSYVFTEYRQPQPPVRTDQIELVECQRMSNQLTAIFKHRIAETAWQCGLTAVIELHDHGMLYFALTHVLDKPDFHQQASFVLRSEIQ